MKNRLIIVLVIIAVTIIGAVLFFRQSATPPSAGNVNTAAPASPSVAPPSSATQTQSSTANFDADDNLDQALQDLENLQSVQ